MARREVRQTSETRQRRDERVTINKEFESFDAFIQRVRHEHLAHRRVHPLADAAPGRAPR